MLASEVGGKVEEIKCIRDAKVAADLENRFSYLPPTRNQVPKYEEIRGRALEMAKFLEKVCPDGREKALALTKLEEMVSWANASIARNG